MKVTARLRYAVRTLCELEDSQDNPMSLTKIEKNQKISKKFLKQILQPLEKNNIIGSKRGKYGGYYLKIKPEKITILKILKALNEEIVIVPCIVGICSAGNEKHCKTKKKWNELQKIIYEFYRKTTIRDFIEGE
jgi:Rrf2 family protein